MRPLIRPRTAVFSACIHGRRPFFVPSLRHQSRSPGSSAWLSTTGTTIPAANTTWLKKRREPQKYTALPDRPCRTRFAPSPTGHLHLGSLRTALFNYLLAKATGGQFILRIEDTDQARTVPGAEERLYHDLKWYGLSWDEGPGVAGPYGPYRQSERLDLYHQHAQTLVDQGKAYRCFCPLEGLKEQWAVAHETGTPVAYPGTCRSISPEESAERARSGETHCIRFLGHDKGTYPRVVDLVYGEIRGRDHISDFTIIKGDGFPTYHFANVVDDHHMKITHVIRGAEWLVSTCKHLALYDAFGWQPPEFCHVGLLVDHQRQKLSKRHGGMDISKYQADGTLPEALLNFSVLLGWSKAQGDGRKRGGNSDVMTLQDMIDNFSLKFTRGDITLTFDKLRFLQEKHSQRITSSPEELLRHGVPFFIEPIDRIFCEVQLGKKLKNPTETAWNGPLGPDLEHLGAPVAAMATSDRAARQRYIANVFIAMRNPKDTKFDAEAFLSTNRFLFWDIPLSALRRCDPLPHSEFELLSWGSVIGFPEVVGYLEDALSKVGEDKWTKDGINELLSPAGMDIVYHTPSPTEGRRARPAFMILRRALCGLDEGPGVSQIATLLGRAETMERVRALRDVDWSPVQNSPDTSSP